MNIYLPKSKVFSLCFSFLSIVILWDAILLFSIFIFFIFFFPCEPTKSLHVLTFYCNLFFLKHKPYHVISLLRIFQSFLQVYRKPTISLHETKGSLQSGPACLSTLFSQHLFIICFALQSCLGTCGSPWSHAISHRNLITLLLIILENSCILQDSAQNAIIYFLPLLFQISVCVTQYIYLLFFINSVHVWSILNEECL